MCDRKPVEHSGVDDPVPAEAGSASRTCAEACKGDICVAVVATAEKIKWEFW